MTIAQSTHDFTALMPGRRHLLAVLLLPLTGTFSPSAAAIDLRDYFPTPNGATWTYAFSDWSATGRCSGERSISVDAASAYMLKLVTVAIKVEKCTGPASESQFTASTETFITDGSGHRLLSRDRSQQQSAERYEWTPSMLVLPNRADIYQAFRSAGSVNEAGTEVRAVTYQATLKYVGVEKVNVPAGSFPAALHLQLTETRNYPAPQAGQVMLRTDRWLGRAVGTVKIKTEVFINGKVAQSTQLQLACSSLTDVQSTKCETREQQRPGD